MSTSPSPAFLTASAVNTNSFFDNLAGTSSAFSIRPIGTNPPSALKSISFPSISNNGITFLATGSLLSIGPPSALNLLPKYLSGLALISAISIPVLSEINCASSSCSGVSNPASVDAAVIPNPILLPAAFANLSPKPVPPIISPTFPNIELKPPKPPKPWPPLVTPGNIFPKNVTTT